MEMTSPVTVTATAQEGPRGLGGWLIALAVPVVVVPLLSLYALLGERPALMGLRVLLDPSNRYYSLWWLPLLVGETLYYLASVIAACWVAVLFLRQRASFPRAFVRFWIFVNVGYALDLAATLLLLVKFEELWKNLDFLAEGRAVLGGWFGLLLWSTYLRKSVRVENTFVK